MDEPWRLDVQGDGAEADGLAKASFSRLGSCG
jgi:hypothetical protein